MPPPPRTVYIVQLALSGSRHAAVRADCRANSRRSTMTNRETQNRETDSVDLFTAFAIGAMIGVGATLLLRPDPPTPTEQVLKRFTPLARRARKAARRARRDFGRSFELSRNATRDA